MTNLAILMNSISVILNIHNHNYGLAAISFTLAILLILLRK